MSTKPLKKPLPKIPIIVIVGPTATGKSDLAVAIARRINGEIISADSRQVYRGLNIGTGKITRREMRGVPHHLLDVADPRIPASSSRRYNVETWRVGAARAITEIHGRGNIPIICGGTGFYIDALVDNITLPNVPPNPKLRARLEKKSAPELFQMLQKLDPRRAKKMLGTKNTSTKNKTNGDFQNPRRLIRAIEIATALGKVPPISTEKKSTGKFALKSTSPYAPIFIGLTLPPDELKKRINIRLEKRLRAGMIDEARELHAPRSDKNKNGGLSYARMHELGLEYRFLAEFLKASEKIHTAIALKKMKKEMTERLATAIWHYARSQMTWFKRNHRIRWFTASKNRHLTKVLNMVD